MRPEMTILMMLEPMNEKPDSPRFRTFAASVERIAIYAAAGMRTHRSCVETFPLRERWDRIRFPDSSVPAIPTTVLKPSRA